MLDTLERDVCVSFHNVMEFQRAVVHDVNLRKRGIRIKTVAVHVVIPVILLLMVRLAIARVV